ncbi:MAG: thioredoxin domain-containing protein [Myxococcaceae bacterium]
MNAPTSGRKNRLALESSPYLRQHADNPVDWYPWGEEALALARRENKPILLSVGYSACHWCHVMAHESFENQRTAELMNAGFVNIKVDREERPDLDQLYQGVVQLMGRGGGWPLTLFLTPDLRPFFGGTYFPPQDKFGMPSFPNLLGTLMDAWVNRADDIEAQAKEFKDGLTFISTHGLGSSPSDLTRPDVSRAGQQLVNMIDSRNGGFGSAPKFPNPMNVSLLLRAWRRGGGNGALSAVLLTLTRMAEGGIYDQLGGGFHRYSVDERWLVPHFEKMLYDNAQLLHLYSEAQQIRPNALWRKTVGETVAYLQREMTAPEGAFYATQDADSEGEEGKFFVWNPAQLDTLLPPDLAALARAHFGVTDKGNFEHGQSVLEVVASAETVAKEKQLPLETVENQLAQVRQTLFDARAKRIAPGRDDKILTGWNGLMIRGLAFASRVFHKPEWATLAARAADFVLMTQWDGMRLRRSFQDGVGKIDGLIEDYGDFAAGLVALFQATFEPKYLDAALAISARALELFWDAEKQAYLSAPRGTADLLVPPYALHDSAFPSGASTLTETQLALAALTGNRAHLEQAATYLKRMRDEMARNPFGYGHLWLAADTLLDGAAEVTVVGPKAQWSGLLNLLNGQFAPTLAVHAHEVGSAVPASLAAALEGKTAQQGKATAYLCKDFACEAPLSDPAQLKARLDALA